MTALLSTALNRVSLILSLVFIVALSAAGRQYGNGSVLIAGICRGEPVKNFSASSLCFVGRMRKSGGLPCLSCCSVLRSTLGESVDKHKYQYNPVGSRVRRAIVDARKIRKTNLRTRKMPKAHLRDLNSLEVTFRAFGVLNYGNVLELRLRVFQRCS